MSNTSPPLSPVEQHDHSTTANGSAGVSKHIRRRTSSFSDRSSVTPKSRHRFSNASQLSDGMNGSGEAGGGTGGGGTGLGNLADELDQLDDEYEEEYEDDSALLEHSGGGGAGAGPEVRDSGIDVSYARKPGSPSQKPPDHDDDDGAQFSPDLDELLTAIAHMSSSTNHEDADPLIPRALARFQDLGNQSGLEASTQRLTTSTNSLSAHLASQSKSLQTLAQSLSPIFSPLPAPAAAVPRVPNTETPASTASDPSSASGSETHPLLPYLDALLQTLPHPDPAPLQQLRVLERDTAEVVATLASLTDTLQLGRQMTHSAARHLRSTLAVVAELRREQERAEAAREELRRGAERGENGGGEGGGGGWEEKLRTRWCRAQCGEIVSGFEENCETLRRRMEAGA